MSTLVRVDQLPSLADVPDDALIAVWSAGKLWAAPRSSVGGGGGGGAGYQFVQANGGSLTQRNTLNFTGLLIASDAGGKTVVNLSSVDVSNLTGTLPLSKGGTGASLSGALQAVRMNAANTALELYTPGAGLNAPISGTDDGKIAIASSGNLSYALLGTANLSPSAGIALTQLASVNANRLLGRDSGSGTPTEISVGGGLDFTGSGSIERSALSGAVSAPAGSNTTAFASGDFGSLDVMTIGTIRIGNSLMPNAGDFRLGYGKKITGGDHGGLATAVSIIDMGFSAGNNTVAFGDSTDSSTHLRGGFLQFFVGNSEVARCASASEYEFRTTKISFNAALLSNVQFGMQDQQVASTAAKTVTYTGQNTSGSATTAGGDVRLQVCAGVAGSGELYACKSNGSTKLLRISDVGMGFFGAAPIAQPTVTGSRASGAALVSLLSQLATLGIIVDGTSV